ncbi:hypothetical protein CgunFtcFv8_008663 [Champsocephalus gunnari]|uniref:LITAF domain-containing protein n=1 Tax=Champsocephalus gunnari TaxID=52237 RepID=A0AAN8D2I5_CHAGU|nr:hypothetical protein CgunFtcFv8_008663 [Champsocephalus gunnari]
MEQGYPPQQQTPPYPGPPMNYGGAMPQPEQHAQPGYYPAAPPPMHQGVTHIIIGNTHLRDVPGQTVCPHCQQSVITMIEHTAGMRAWTLCMLFFIFGCIPCCFIPFCIDSCNDVEHRCSSCQRVIYVYKPSEN